MTRVVKGHTYYHDSEGKTWKIRVSFVYSRDPKRIEWVGVLSGAQHGLFDGDKCWGYIDELRITAVKS